MLTVPSRLDAMHRLGRGLADPTRCRILLALLDGPAYPAQLADSLGLTRSNVSNHLACARGCGLVVAAPEGRQMRYELADAHLAHALRDLPPLHPLETGADVSMLTCPVLVVGQEDDDAHPGDLAREIAQRLPDARLRVFGGGGLVWAHRAELRALLATFLNP